MAERFSLLNSQEISVLSDKSSYVNTTRTTKTWINIFRQWDTLRSKDTELEKYDAVAMDTVTVLSQFYGEIRKCDGSDYEPDSLRCRGTLPIKVSS